MLCNRFVEGSELDKVTDKLLEDCQLLQGEEYNKRRERWVAAVREGVYQIMQVCSNATSCQMQNVQITSNTHQHAVLPGLSHVQF